MFKILPLLSRQPENNVRAAYSLRLNLQNPKIIATLGTCILVGLLSFMALQMKAIHRGMEDKVTAKVLDQQDQLCQQVAYNLQKDFEQLFNSEQDPDLSSPTIELLQQDKSQPWGLDAHSGMAKIIFHKGINRGKVIAVDKLHQRHLAGLQHGVHGVSWVMSPEGTMLIDRNTDLLGKNIYQTFKDPIYHDFLQLEPYIQLQPDDQVGRFEYRWPRDDGAEPELRLISFIKTSFADRSVIVCNSFSRASVSSFIEEDTKRLEDFFIISTLVLIFIFATLAFIYRAKSRMEKQRSQLSQFLAPQIVQQVIDQHLSLEQHVQRRDVSVFFIDLRNFTSLSETMEVECLSEFLTDFYETCTQGIFEHQGTVDKYLGDSVMAYFGAPQTIENFPLQAVLCAQQLLTNFESFKQRWQHKTPDIPLDCGIAIATGSVMTGPIGSKNKVDYTVIGPTVNLASRMEGLNKRFQSKLIICSTTQQALSQTQASLLENFKLNKDVQIRGVSQSKDLYTLN